MAKDKGKVWNYALFLVTRTARLIRVSNYAFANEARAKAIATKLGLDYSPLVPECGTLKAALDQSGKPALSYSHRGDGWVGVLYLLLLIGVSYVLCCVFS